VRKRSVRCVEYVTRAGDTPDCRKAAPGQSPSCDLTERHRGRSPKEARAPIRHRLELKRRSGTRTATATEKHGVSTGCSLSRAKWVAAGSEWSRMLPTAVSRSGGGTLVFQRHLKQRVTMNDFIWRRIALLHPYHAASMDRSMQSTHPNLCPMRKRCCPSRTWNPRRREPAHTSHPRCFLLGFGDTTRAASSRVLGISSMTVGRLKLHL